MSRRFASIISLLTGVWVDWMVEPLQSVVESLLEGHKSGLQVGDLAYARVSLYIHTHTCLYLSAGALTLTLTYQTKLNYNCHIVNAYLAGQELTLCLGQFSKSIELQAKRGLWLCELIKLK